MKFDFYVKMACLGTNMMTEKKTSEEQDPAVVMSAIGGHRYCPLASPAECPRLLHIFFKWSTLVETDFLSHCTVCHHVAEKMLCFLLQEDMAHHILQCIRPLVALA